MHSKDYPFSSIGNNRKNNLLSLYLNMYLLSLWRAESQREKNKDKEISSLYRLTSQMSSTVRIGPEQNQEPELNLELPYKCEGTGIWTTVFQGCALTRRWVGSGRSDVYSDTLMVNVVFQAALPCQMPATQDVFQKVINQAHCFYFNG